MIFHPLKLSFQQAFNPKNNSLGFIRLFLAILVVLQHSYHLGGFGNEPLTSLNAQLNSGTLAVHSFFIISGFLITSSYLKLANIWQYLWHRVLRIFPAFWVCLIIISLFFAPLTYFATYRSLAIPINSSISYILQNFLLIINQPDIENLLSSHIEQSFNGSLWTLQWEFILYIFIGVLGLFSLFTKKYKYLVVAIFIIFFITNYIIDPCHCTILLKYYTHPRIPPLFCLFLAGSLFCLYQDKIPHDKRFFVLSLLLSIIALKFNFYFWLETFTLPYIILCLSIYLPWKNFDTKYGDYSYGIYIYHFPILQLLIAYKLEKLGVLIYSLIGLLLTLPFAYASWNLIEKPSLKFKNINFKLPIYFK
ncbi:MAG: acyltransferase [Aulosira sp. DedQUE10]|nr:acyltransferase [Aulosira sp. DedQUE10]